MEQSNARSQSSKSSESAGGISAKSREAAEHVKGAVVDQANEVRDQAQSAKENTTKRIRSVASQLRTVGDALQSEDSLASNAAYRAGRGVEDVAAYLDSASLQRVVQDTERLARRQPTLFFGGAFLLGLVAGRFLKSAGPGTRMDGPRQSQSQRYAFDAQGTPHQDRPSGFFSSREEGSSTNTPRVRPNDGGERDWTDSERRPEPRTARGSTASGVGVGASTKPSETASSGVGSRSNTTGGSGAGSSGAGGSGTGGSGAGGAGKGNLP